MELPSYTDVDDTPVTVTIDLPELIGRHYFSSDSPTKSKIVAYISPSSVPQNIAQRLIEEYILPDYCKTSLITAIQYHRNQIRQNRLDSRDDNASSSDSDDMKNLPKQWAETYVHSWKSYRIACQIKDVSDDSDGYDEDNISFSQMFHDLIHSPFLNRLIEIQDGYASFIQEMIEKRNKALERLEEAQFKEQEDAVARLEKGILTSSDVTSLTRQHAQDRELTLLVLATASNLFLSFNAVAIMSLSGGRIGHFGSVIHLANLNTEIKMQKEIQRRAFRDIVVELSHNPKEGSEFSDRKREFPDSTATNSFESNSLEQGKTGSIWRKFRFVKGRNKQSMDRSLSQGSIGSMQRSIGENDEPMIASFTVTLGTQKKVEHNLRLISGDIIDMCGVEAHAKTVDETKAQRLVTSMSLYSTDLRAVVIIVDTRLSSYTGPKAEFAAVCEQSTDLHFPELSEQIELLQMDLSASHGGIKDNSLCPGDFYVTRHGNLADTHVVFHLVSDDETMKDTLSGRSQVLFGLRNIFRCMFQNDIQTMTLPVLLLHKYTSDADDRFCEKRFELLLKTIKGFIMENTAWGRSTSKTIQLMVPKDTSPGRFSMFVEIMASIFRETRTLSA
eukprot:gene540-3858_t